jgi:hypothetical protein
MKPPQKKTLHAGEPAGEGSAATDIDNNINILKVIGKTYEL